MNGRLYHVDGGDDDGADNAGALNGVADVDDDIGGVTGVDGVETCTTVVARV